MNTTTFFSDHIRRVKQLVLIRTMIRIVFLTAGLFLCGYTVLTLLERFANVSITDVARVYGGLLLAAFLLAVIYAIVTRTRLLDILIDIDTRLHLQDRLSTAYEYQAQAKTSDFLELLIQDAGHKLGNLTRNQMFPFRFSRLHLFILVLILLNLAIVGLDRMLHKESMTPPLNPMVSEQIQKALEEYLRKNLEPEEQEVGERNRQRQLRQELQQIARKLQEQTMTRKEMMEALQQNLKEIQSQQDRLTDELEADLKTIDNIRELPVRDMPRFERLSASELRKLEKMMGEMLDGELPEDIKESMAMLQQYDDAEGMLEEMLEDLERLSEDDLQVAQGESGGGSSQGESEERQQQENASSGQGQSDQFPPELEGEFGQGFPGQSIPGLDGEGEDDSLTSPAPGKSVGDKELGPSSPIDRGQGDTLQDRMASSQKAEYTTHIRSVTKIGDPTVPEEEITRQYTRELESILQKEDIPLNYREYIKSYFLSIGIESEE